LNILYKNALTIFSYYLLELWSEEFKWQDKALRTWSQSWRSSRNDYGRRKVASQVCLDFVVERQLPLINSKWLMATLQL